MSGICAVRDLEGLAVDLERLRAAARVASYRGPDGIAYMTLDAVGLAHLALRSTPEAASETQPASSDDRRLAVVADVRLDRREALADELRSAGTLRAAHPGDAQLILAAYERWVEECPAHLDGDYAFVLWDGRKRQLFCARDRHGSRPLHFALLGTTVWVGSDLQQILTLPEAPREIDPAWLAAYLVDRPAEPQRTPFRQLRRLPPGWRSIVSSSAPEVDRVPSPPAAPSQNHDDDAGDPEDPAEAFDTAVRSCLRTNSPVVGLLLSDDPGGDLLATTAGRLNAESGDRRQLIALLPVPRTLPAGIARSVPVSTDTGPEAVTQPGADRTPAIDSPIASWEVTAASQLRALARLGGTVLLTTLGQGSDAASSLPPGLPVWLAPQFVSVTGIDESLTSPASADRSTGAMPWPLATTSLHRTLAWIERLAAEHGIEVRHPFLDCAVDFVPDPPGDRTAVGPVRHVPPEAIAQARSELATEPWLVRLGICHPTRYPRALVDAGNASGPERDALWRALTLERWLRIHDLHVA